MDNAVFDFFYESLQKLDWLGFSTIYFDNSYVIDIPTCEGYVAYSPSKECFFALKHLDSTMTSIVEGKLAVLNQYTIAPQTTVTVASTNHLQHFDLAQYTRKTFYSDGQEKMPVPKIPSRADIMALVIDPETGFAAGADEVTRINHKKQAAVCIFEGTDETATIDKPESYQKPYSGAVVDEWQRFYKNQEKFRAFLSEMYGVTDAI